MRAAVRALDAAASQKARTEYRYVLQLFVLRRTPNGPLSLIHLVFFVLLLLSASGPRYLSLTQHFMRGSIITACVWVASTFAILQCEFMSFIRPAANFARWMPTQPCALYRSIVPLRTTTTTTAMQSTEKQFENRKTYETKTFGCLCVAIYFALVKCELSTAQQKQQIETKQFDSHLLVFDRY